MDIVIIIMVYKVIVIMDGQEDHKIKFQGVRPTAALEQTSEQDKWEKKVILLDKFFFHQGGEGGTTSSHLVKDNSFVSFKAYIALKHMFCIIWSKYPAALKRPEHSWLKLTRRYLAILKSELQRGGGMNDRWATKTLK